MEDALGSTFLLFMAETSDEKFSQSPVFVSPSPASKSVIASLPVPQSKEFAPSRPASVSSPVSPKSLSLLSSNPPTNSSPPLPP